MEGYGNMLSDSGSRKESNSEGIVLQIAVSFTAIFYLSITGQSDYPR